MGEFWEDVRVYQDQITRLGLEDRVLLIPRYIPNEEVTFYFSAADLVVLPYLETATSAVVHLAFGFDKPVIGTTMGGLREVVMDGETGYLVPPGNSLALADAIVRFFDENAGPEFSARIAQERKERSWDKLVHLIEQMVTDG